MKARGLGARVPASHLSARSVPFVLRQLPYDRNLRAEVRAPALAKPDFLHKLDI